MHQCQFCGRQFESKSAYTQHERYHCELNPNRRKVNQTKFYTEHKKVACTICGKLFDVANIKRHEASCARFKLPIERYSVDHEGLNCKFCEKLCKNLNSLTQHELRCKENPNRKNFNSLDSFNAKEAELKATVGLTKETSIRVANSAKTLKARYQSGELVNAMKGKPGTFTGRKHREESKAKTRASTLAYIENTCGPLKVRYNVNACRYIDYLNTRFGWQLQHAENGGEIRVCNYFLDGYDAALNIAFEYDEPRHYADALANALCERDISRMRTIIEELGCRFIRYNEQLNLLYEIGSDLVCKQL